MAATLFEHMAAARHRLTEAGIPEADAALDAEVLARHALGWDRAALLTHGREPPPPGFPQAYEALIARREAREPVAYITGIREFWDREFEVTREVLIPRPETELIVEVGLELARARRMTIIDVGTGSGCLAVTFAAELPHARVVASDTSAAALQVARRNAARHGVEARLAWLRADLLDAIRGPVDLVVSNPPYVPSGEVLPPEVALYEPPDAVFAGPDGLAVLRRLIPAARTVLAPGGAFVVEFGFAQSEAVQALARAAGWSQVEMHADLQGIPRVAVMR